MPSRPTSVAAIRQRLLTGFTTRELARAFGLPHRNVIVAVLELEKTGRLRQLASGRWVFTPLRSKQSRGGLSKVVVEGLAALLLAALKVPPPGPAVKSAARHCKRDR